MLPIFLFTALFSLLFGKFNTKITTQKIMMIAYGLIGEAMFSLGMIDKAVPNFILCPLLICIGIGTCLAVPATSVKELNLVES